MDIEHMATIRKALANWHKVSQELIFLYEDKEAELERINAALAALEATQAGECWTPVEDGDLHSFLAVQDNGETVAVFVDDDYGYAEEALPDDVRLCRRTTPRPNTQSLLSHARTSTKLQVTQTYALALHNQSAVDWKAVNEAIINRWNMTTLKRIKDWAWEAYRHEQKAQKEQ